MGTISQPQLAKTGLANALFGTTQQRVLGLLFGNPERNFYSKELILLAGCGSGAVQRELAKLLQSGLITAHSIGRQKHYQANKHSSLFDELCSIVRKTVGLADPLRHALLPLTSRIDGAFIYGSFAKSEDTAQSDIDLMILADDLTYAEIFERLEAVSDALGRRVNPTIVSFDRWAQGRTEDSFLKRVSTQPKIWLFELEGGKAP